MEPPHDYNDPGPEEWIDKYVAGLRPYAWPWIGGVAFGVCLLIFLWYVER